MLDIINDIFGIVQTHADSNSNLQIHDFRHYVKHREKSKGKRNSGGIAVYIVRKTIIEGTSFATTRNKNILWIKLDKSFFELDKDLYLGTVYTSPNASQVIDQELLDDIEREIVNFTLKGDVILQGDFNARTGSMQEFAVHDDDNQFLEIPEDYEIDTENYRYSQDENTTNSRGRILIDLCTALSLRILNGRVVGDLTGKKTCFKYNGSSVVDYVILSPVEFSIMLITLLSTICNPTYRTIVPFHSH